MFGEGTLLTYNKKTSVYTLHAYANGMHVARKTTAESNYYYYHEDATGSVRLVMKGTQANPWFRTDYLPFGRTFNTTTANPEDFKFLDTRPTKVSGLLPFGERFYDADSGRFLTGDSVLGSLSSPSSNNRWAYCVNDPVNRVDLAGQWPSFQDVCNFVGSLADDAVNLLGDAAQALADTAVEVARIGRFAVQTALDVGQRMLDDIKQAAYSVADAVVSGLVAVKEAWDNLDPGLKQWIINGVAFAVSFIPIAGPLISCIIDGTFVDMFSAIMTGNWAMVGMCALAFVPGAGKLAKVGLKSFEKVGIKSLEKSVAKFKPYKILSKEASKEGKEAHHLLEKRLAERLGITDSGTIPSVALTRAEHQKITNELRKEIAYGTDYSTLSNAEIRNAYASVYGEGSDWFKAIEHYFV